VVFQKRFGIGDLALVLVFLLVGGAVVFLVIEASTRWAEAPTADYRALRQAGRDTFCERDVVAGDADDISAAGSSRLSLRDAYPAHTSPRQSPRQRACLLSPLGWPALAIVRLPATAQRRMIAQPSAAAPAQVPVFAPCRAVTRPAGLLNRIRSSARSLRPFWLLSV
jgi:hypothetical protein